MHDSTQNLDNTTIRDIAPYWLLSIPWGCYAVNGRRICKILLPKPCNFLISGIEQNPRARKDAGGAVSGSGINSALQLMTAFQHPLTGQLLKKNGG